jgi:hypothetical protein
MSKSAVGVAAASERLAERFTRSMRASTSRWGVLTDPPVVCAGLSVVVLASVILFNLDVIHGGQLPFVYAAIAGPILLAMGINASLGGARRAVAGWLGELPFPVDNVNALLNGVGQHLVVRFGEAPPQRQLLTDLLDDVHVDCFALEFHDVEPEVELVIGVPDSKINPATASFHRYARVRRMIDDCLVPLSEQYAIEWVRIA